MAVKIRLTRMGSKKKPFYRINVADSRAPQPSDTVRNILSKEGVMKKFHESKFSK